MSKLDSTNLQPRVLVWFCLSQLAQQRFKENTKSDLPSRRTPSCDENPLYIVTICTVYSVQCTVYSVQCTVNSVKCTAYC